MLTHNLAKHLNIGHDDVVYFKVRTDEVIMRGALYSEQILHFIYSVQKYIIF